MNRAAVGRASIRKSQSGEDSPHSKLKNKRATRRIAR